ncbi:MAG: DUF2339 domain-containing protein [Acidobacteriota bacterium]|nr:DUF2339 domain-containing protein [Acidobacteriota bacterium]
MAADEHQPPRTSLDPEAALAALTARVYTLEREVAELRGTAPPSTTAPPPKPAAIHPPTAPTSATHPTKPKASLEDRIGSQLFSRIGIVALLIATALFLKWAIDNQWIGPLGRVLAGLLAGAAVILWSERFRRTGFPAFSYSLKAIGSGALYLSLWAAFQLYHLLPAAAALAAMVFVTVWNAYMAWSQNSEILAAYALTGAFVTPLLLSTGANQEVFLFTYLLSIDLATIALVHLKSWPRLLLGAFPATAAYFITWYISWYGFFGLHPFGPFGITTLFIALFFLAFLTPSLRTAAPPHSDESAEPPYTPILEVFLPLANAAFTAFALYMLLEDAHHHDLLPWVALLLAAIYLALTRLPQPQYQTRLTSAIHLTLAIVFLTIAIPLKATGRWITIGWLAEAVALLWISSRLTSPAATAASFAVNPTTEDPTTSTEHPITSTQDPTTQVPHLRRNLIAAKVGHRESDPLSPPHPPHSSPSTTLRRLGIVALALGVAGLLLQPLWLYSNVPTAFLNTRFATALTGILALALASAIALHAHRTQREELSPSWLSIAATSVLALNLTAILATVRELATIWQNPAGNPDADLQRSLSISAFLMLYGAALLAAGFWKRSAFLRWQALVLLVFTIGKVFLYDLRSLSQGYRILSILGLGALLMAISFAYQKDWLALRASEPEPEPAPELGTRPESGTKPTRLAKPGNPRRNPAAETPSPQPGAPQ